MYNYSVSKILKRKEGVIISNFQYKLIGALNLHGYTSDIVYPIYEKEGIYYFQNTKKGIIESFSKIQTEFMISRIKHLTNENTNFVGVKRFYTIADKEPHIYQINSNAYFVSDLKNFIDFLKRTKITNLEVRMSVNSFIKEHECYLEKENQRKSHM